MTNGCCTRPRDLIPLIPPAIIISYTIVSRSPRGGGGWPVPRGESNGRNLYSYSRIPGAAARVDPWIYARASYPFDSSGWRPLRYIRRNSSGWQRKEFDGFSFLFQRLLLIGLESRREKSRRSYCFNKIGYIELHVLILNWMSTMFEKKKKDNRWISTSNLRDYYDN